MPLVVEPGFVTIQSDQGWVRVPDIALPILDYFSSSHTAAEAAKALAVPAMGIEHWKLLTSTIVSLIRCGALVPESQPGAVASANGFAAPPVHIRMLNDGARTGAYLDAISRAVRPDDVVLDLGTGVGVLAIAAARAGARRVFAIERSAIADVAEAMFVANGVADRVTLLRGWSTSLQLPERATLMVSEIIGIDPFEEHVAEFTNDARQRLLKQGARLIPSRMRVKGLLVSVPEERVARATFRQESIALWTERYKMDFSALLRQGPVPGPLKVMTPETGAMYSLSDAVEIVDIDFTQPLRASLSFDGTVEVTNAGFLNAVLIYFELTLGDGVGLTTSPSTADARNSWGNLVILIPGALDVGRGDRVRLQVTRMDGQFSATCVEEHQSATSI